MTIRNVFSNLPATLPEELTDRLASSASMRIERIVSTGQCSPADFWYDQEESEWVIVLQGAANLQFEGTEAAMELRVGDFVEIPAHRKHRVQWTSPNEVTVWLAIFYNG